MHLITILLLQLIFGLTMSFVSWPSRVGRACRTESCRRSFPFEAPNAIGSSRGIELYMSGQMLEFRPEKDNDAFQSTSVNAEIGAELSEVAEEANIPIAYQCRKGECGTCEVNLNGKWVRTCQTQVPAMSKNEDLVVIVKKIKKKPAKFFSPKSFAEGVFNNGLGVAGFVWRGARSGEEFQGRMEQEDEIAALVAKRKAEKDRNLEEAQSA